MNEKRSEIPESGSMFARFGNGHWYAILPSMAEGFRKSGATVSNFPDKPYVQKLNAKTQR